MTLTAEAQLTVTELRARADLFRRHPERWVPHVPEQPLQACAIYDMDGNGLVHRSFTTRTLNAVTHWFYWTFDRPGANLVVYNDVHARSAQDIVDVFDEAARWFESHDIP